MTVRRAGSEDRAAVVAAFEVANLDEAVTAWVLEDRSENIYLDSSYAQDRVDTALREDEVWVAGVGQEIWAISVWQYLTSLRRLEVEVAKARRWAEAAPNSRPLRRIAEASDVLLRTHPREFPHNYLEVIVTVPEHRGQGAGGAVLADRLAASSAQGVPAYLEASTERSARLYTSRGFVRTGTTHPLPDNGPTLIPMWFRP
ncbi:GNAT family N-acetyltransferase [Nocardia callitridis]|uniref:GNAT family N-acetyltransferase n=2 Tax=Nocardia callitridis TaxID=648753 RepID=A0ABP9KGU4_9NOCA